MGFDSAFIETVGLEGGFSDNPGDAGNWTGGRIGAGTLRGTKYGISAAAYPGLDIRNLSEGQAKDIYLRDYWQPMRLDEIASEVIHREIFDTGVNCGAGTAIKITQRALNFLGDSVVEDGVIGPVTIARINAWTLKDEGALFKAMNGFQFIRYLEIVAARNDHRFSRGWMKRIQDYRRENPKEDSFDELIRCHP